MGCWCRRKNNTHLFSQGRNEKEEYRRESAEVRSVTVVPTAPCQTAVLGCSDFTDRSPTARYFRCCPTVDGEGDRNLCFVSQVSRGERYMNDVRYVNPKCTISVIYFILACVCVSSVLSYSLSLSVLLFRSWVYPGIYNPLG